MLINLTDNKRSNNEAGNVLLYILGAIALLGLLIISVKGSSTSGSNINEEELMLRVGEIQQYGAELENAVSIILQNGFSETDIRFAHPDAASAYGVITDIPARQIFSRDGGGATYRAPSDDLQITATDWLFNANNKVNQVGSSTCGATDNCTDLIAFLRNVTLGFCNLINDHNDIITDPPPTDNSSIDITTAFIGSFIESDELYASDDSLNGKTEGCFEEGNGGAAGPYHYYRVLLAR